MGSPLLVIEGVHKGFGGVKVLTGVDLTLAPGTVKCIIGPNGCGKSTLFNILSGVLLADSGRILFSGARVDNLPAHRIARAGMLRKFQVPGILPNLSVIENLEAARVGVAGGGVIASFLAGSLGSRKSAEDCARRLKGAGLHAYYRMPVEQLPHGLKQRLEILMLLSREPRLLLLDEPTAGMTSQETAETARLIRAISAEEGIAVLAIEHDMHFVRDLDCPVAVMLDGVVQSEGDYDSVRRDPRVRAAYLGEAA